MRMVGLRLVPVDFAASQLCNPAIVVDILWAVAWPEDRLEHIFIEPASGLVHLVFFQRVDSFEYARDRIIGLWRRASEGSHLLRGRFDIEICSLDWT